MRFGVLVHVAHTIFNFVHTLFTNLPDISFDKDFIISFTVPMQSQSPGFSLIT